MCSLHHTQFCLFVCLSWKFRNKQMHLCVCVSVCKCVLWPAKLCTFITWPFIHLTVHLPTCLSGCLYVGLIRRSFNMLMLHSYKQNWPTDLSPLCHDPSNLKALTSDRTIYIYLSYQRLTEYSVVPIIFTKQKEKLCHYVKYLALECLYPSVKVFIHLRETDLTSYLHHSMKSYLKFHQTYPQRGLENILPTFDV